MNTDRIRDLLLKEMEQINEYARVLFQVYVAWLTFFITILLAAMAAAIKASLKKGIVRFPRIVYFIGALFGIQVIFGIIACVGLNNELSHMDSRLNTITTNLVAVSQSSTNSAPVGYIKPQSTIPDVMSVAVLVGICTLVSHFVLWAILVWKIHGWSKTKEQVLGDQID
jgi:uncharacterized membrane protein